jgi:hypothetical protein
MAENSKMQPPTDEQVKTFIGLKTHADKCAHFHKPENANLALLFHPVHFPAPVESPESSTV